MRAADARQRQHAQANAQHPAAIDPAKVAQRRHQRQRNQLRQRRQQHDRRGLHRAITLDLRQVAGRNNDHRLQHHQHARQGQQGERQVTDAEHLHLEKRNRLRPLAGQKQHQQQQPAAEQSADQVRLEPVQAIALQDADHQHADGGKAQQHTTPVEGLEALQAQGVLG
ncbi:hypothetical protein D3C75_498570 [compost metagenome]